MSVYLIADIKVTNNKWVPTYAASVHDLVHKHGGKYLARSGNIETLEGKPLDTDLIASISFPRHRPCKASFRIRSTHPTPTRVNMAAKVVSS